MLKNLKAGASKVECRPSALFLLALGLFQNNCFKFKYYNYFDLKQCSGHKVDAVAANPMNHRSKSYDLFKLNNHSNIPCTKLYS